MIKNIAIIKADDTFEITSHDLGETLQKLNDTDENNEFTMEKASKGNLPFLACIISFLNLVLFFLFSSIKIVLWHVSHH